MTRKKTHFQSQGTLRTRTIEGDFQVGEMVSSSGAKKIIFPEQRYAWLCWKLLRGQAKWCSPKDKKLFY